MSVPTPMKAGDEFSLFSHRWRVIGVEPGERGSRWRAPAADAGLVCRQIASA